MSIERFYDEHPYPPPPADLTEYAERWGEPARRRAEFHLRFPYRAYDEQRRILVAGCGTAQAAKYAIRHPEAVVLGIDVSPASLAQERRLKDVHGLDNLQLRELPIEEAGELDTRFDEIVCTGVLHHLADPSAGLRALRGVLAPGGVALLMVYARYGRTGVAMIAEYARMAGVQADRQDVIDLAQTLAEVPLGHPIGHLLRDTPDFRSVDALADALLNPREVAYSAPELLDLLDATGWDARRWYRQAPYLPGCGAMAKTPHHDRVAALPARERFAAMELFRGTITTHSLIMVAGTAAATEVLDGADWANLVPLRMPGARTIDERTPPGAAAVLLNEQHSFTDLVLPIDESQRLVVDAIDGQRRIRDITVPDEPTRAFFRTLWDWDQVVFDASGTDSGRSIAERAG